LDCLYYFASGAATTAGDGKSGWGDRIRPLGDMRRRYEWDGNRFSGAGNRSRVRARLRIGAKTDVTDELVGGRVDADAVFNPLIEDDFQSLASNFKGHIARIDWGITKGVKIRTWERFQKPKIGGPLQINKR
jgi:hypothetical protein